VTAFIVAARRTAVAPRGGAFAALEVHEIAAPVIRAALQEAGIAPDQVDELILSNALGAGGNPARVAALAAGLPQAVAGLSIDRQCAGGLDAILLAGQMIASGAAEIVVAGGVESYSRRPLRLRTFADGRTPEPYDQPAFTPWPDADPDMAEAADALGISRNAQDDWAIASHAKAIAARADTGEIVPLAGLSRDAFTRRLSPALCGRARIITGNITAANTAVAADAAAVCVVVSERIAARLTQSGVRLLAGATRGGDPRLPGLAPVAAIRAALSRLHISPATLATAEIMEAYAAQAIACIQGSGIDPAIVNPGGGALARGHPIGASGAINAVRLVHELRRTGGTGIAAAGGIATALLLSAG
jgi:acetyl-CoA C-acetyltransferase